MVEPETAGEPTSDQKWVRSSLRELSGRLAGLGHAASPPTVGRLLKGLEDALHVNAKQRDARASHPARARQCTHLADVRQAFAAAGQPMISVDPKKQELIGNFRNAGRAWGRQAEAVNVHDFRQDSLGRAVPYGIYDLMRNRGTVCVGQSGDTPRFAVGVIAQWWQDEGQAAFPGATELLVLADAGGSNGCGPRRWKHQLQEQLADRFGLTVTVCHYPTGCAKWNPIEDRLFGQISRNWAGQPLRTWETMLGYIRGTKTVAGLQVQAYLDARPYPTGERVSDAEMAGLNLERHAICPTWNYTIRPRRGVSGNITSTGSGRVLNA